MTEEIKETIAQPTESMADFEQELNASFRKIQEGDIVTGTVINVSEESVTLDLRYYAAGIIKNSELSDDPSFSALANIHEGDELSAMVIRMDDGEGNLLLSMREANDILAWNKLKEYFENETILHVKIGGIVNAGVIAYVEGIRGFIPASQLSLTYVEDLNEWLGKELDVKVITVDAPNKRLVLSGKSVAKERELEEQQQKIARIVIGTVVEGTVESLMPYGAFVRLGNGLSGLVHISQISQKRIKKPSEVLKEGQTVKVKILNTDNGKISLSMKALEEEAVDESPEEAFELPQSEAATTNLASLLSHIKL